jgi:hypothetical protein
MKGWSFLTNHADAGVLVQNPLACWPRSVSRETWSRSRSPVAICGTPKCSAMSPPWVPLPAPGAAGINMRKASSLKQGMNVQPMPHPAVRNRQTARLGDRLLDVACGAGLPLELAALRGALRGAECAGIDASSRLVPSPETAARRLISGLGQRRPLAGQVRSAGRDCVSCCHRPRWQQETSYRAVHARRSEPPGMGSGAVLDGCAGYRGLALAGPYLDALGVCFLRLGYQDQQHAVLG